MTAPRCPDAERFGRGEVAIESRGLGSFSVVDHRCGSSELSAIPVPSGRIWRRGWDSHPCRVVKTKNLTDFAFLTIRQIRSKTEVETRIEHADRGERRRLAWLKRAQKQRFAKRKCTSRISSIFFVNRSGSFTSHIDRVGWGLLSTRRFGSSKGPSWGQCCRRDRRPANHGPAPTITT